MKKNKLKIIIASLLVFFSVTNTKAQGPSFNIIGSMGGSTYSVYSDSTSWTVADSLCSAHGGHLIVINSQQEADYINSLLGLSQPPSTNNAYWIGLLDSSSTWVNGDSLIFNNYAGSYIQGQYSHMYLQSNGLWDNSPNNGSEVPTGIFALMENPCPPSMISSGINASSVMVNDGQVTVVVSGGNGPFSYYLTELNGSLVTNPTNPSLSNPASSHTFFNLSSGAYKVALLDAGCPGTNLSDTVIITAPGGSLSYNGSFNLCGVATTDITAYFSGCSSTTTMYPNQYILSNITTSTTILDSTIFSDSMIFSSLTPGTYALSAVNYNNGCTAQDTFTISGSSFQNNIITTNVSSSSILGSASIILNGGTPSYNIMFYQYPPAFTNTQSPFTSGDTISNLPIGSYAFIISDNSTPPCNTIGSFEIIHACSAQLIDNYGPCHSTIYLDGVMTMVDTSNSSYEFNYALSDGSTTLNTINNSLNDTVTFSNGISNAGQYFLTVTEINTGCVALDTITINTLTPLLVNTIVTPVSFPGICDGQIFVNPTSSAPFTLEWDTNGVILPTTSPIQPNLCESPTYCVTITDTNNCTYNECFDLQFVPCNVNLSVFDSIPCDGGIGTIQVDIDTSNVIGPDPFSGDRYVYSLYTTNPLTPYGIPQSSNSPLFLFPNLSSGEYLVMVYDSSYSTYCSSDTLFLSQPDPIAVYITVDSTSAPWLADGQITIDSITGGTQPYNISWLDNAGNSLPPGLTVQAGLAYANAYTGGYEIIITDTNGCNGGLADIYIHPKNSGDSLYIDSTYSKNPTCYGDCDGFLWAKFKNIGTYAVPPFVFYWLDDQGNTIVVDSLGTPWYNPSHIASFNGTGNLACAGDYTLHAYDYYGNGPIIQNFTLTNPDSLLLHMYLDMTIDCGADTILRSSIQGGNVTNDTILVSSGTLNVTNNIAAGFSTSLINGANYLLVVSGTYSDASGNTYDAAFNYTPTPPVSDMNWTFDGSSFVQPTPNSYNASHVYNYPFTGSGVHQFEFLNFGLVYSGVLNFDFYYISIDTTFYTHAWSTNPPSFPFIISTADTVLAYPGVTPTDYILTVTDQLGCSVSDTVNVAWDLLSLNFSNVTVLSALCNGDSSGTIIMSADTSTGFPPYSYILNTLPAQDTVIDLPPGAHVISIVDAIGCTSIDSTVHIAEPDSLVLCGMDTVLVEHAIDSFFINFDTITTSFSYTTLNPTQLGLSYKLVVSGEYRDTWGNTSNSPFKDAAYRYNVSPEIPISDWGWIGNPPVGQRPNPDVYDPLNHEYTYYFTGDGNYQIFSYTDGIYYDNAGLLSFKLYKLTCDTTEVTYTCFNDSTAISSVFASGGIPFNPDGIPNSGDEYYQYEWIRTNPPSSTVWSTSSIAAGLPYGDYRITVTDSLGCAKQRHLQVIQSAQALNIDSVYTENILCKYDSTGYIWVEVSGGFTTGDDLAVLILGNDTVFTQSGALDTFSIVNLVAGTYQLYVYDSIPDFLYGVSACNEFVEIEIIEPQDELSSTVNLLDNVTCFGDSTGIASANVIGGQFPYTYAWDNGETTPIADSLWAGWQAITFTDSNGCTLRDSVEILHLNNDIVGTLDILQDVSCFGGCDGIATISSFGGILPHTYFWDIGQQAFSMPDTAFNLCYGGHDVVIVDAVGCDKIVPFFINQPTQLLAEAELVAHVTCNGFENGLAFASAVGGTSPYSFVWDSINGQTGQHATNLTPGIHTVFVTDAEGCTASDTMLITQPDSLKVVIDSSMIIYPYCLNTHSGQLCAIASGGTEPYNYIWDDILAQTTPCAYNLNAGIYTVTVKDKRDCIASVSYDLDSITNTMTASGVSMTIDSVSCWDGFDGKVSITNVTGGVAAYDYAWTGPGGYTSSDSSISSLTHGSYSCAITDTNGCVITINAEVGQPDKLWYTTTNVIGSTCDGACNGQIWVDITGGLPPYYFDNDEAGLYPFVNQQLIENDSMILDLCHGQHEVYITDKNKCIGYLMLGGTYQEFVDTGVVVYIDGITTTDASCQNGNDGTAMVDSPNPLFTYTWALGGTILGTGTSISILSPGSYTLTAHYADSASFGQPYTGCNVVQSFSIGSVSSAVSLIGTTTDVLCYEDTNGTIDVTTSNGSGSYAWQWDTTTSLPNGATTEDITGGLQVGTYAVTVTDLLSGCTFTKDFTIGGPDPIKGTPFNVSNVSCFGLNDGEVTVLSEGGTGTTTHTYEWLPSGGTNATASNLIAGYYSVIVTDANGCKDTVAQQEITEPDPVIDSAYIVAFYNDDASGNPYHVSCIGSSDGSAIVTTGGGTSPYTFEWEDDSGSLVSIDSSTGEILSAGTYTITVTDSEGCEQDQDITLREPTQIFAKGTQDVNSYGFNISCGNSDGYIEIDPFGGVPYNGNVYEYLWTGNLGGQASNKLYLENLDAGTYNVEITDRNGCTYDTSFTLTAPIDTFNAYIINDYSGPQSWNYLVTFDDLTKALYPSDDLKHTFEWIEVIPPGFKEDDGTPNLSNDTLRIVETETFPENEIQFTHNYRQRDIGFHEVYVLVENLSTGCEDYIGPFFIEVQGMADLTNVFTPNGDNMNDEFDFGDHGMQKMKVDIFNRWSQLVYQWEGEHKSWDGNGMDGEKIPEGVYFYIMEATGIDGEKYSEKGSVTLIR